MHFLKLPENTQGRDFVVGDLHGRFNDLQEAMRLNQFDPGKDRIISCGDLIDRGSGSLELGALLDEPWFFSVRGNHEQMFLDGFSGFIGLPEGEKPRTEKAREYIQGAGGYWVRSAPEIELYRLRDRLQQLPLVIEVCHHGQRFVMAHAELPGGGKLNPVDFDAGLSRLDQEQHLVTWSIARARVIAKDSLSHRVDGVDYAIFGHTSATYLTAQGYFFRFDNRVYIDASFVPASRLLLDLSQMDALPIYPKPQLETLAQDLEFEASTVFAVDLPSGETIQATLQTEYTLPNDTRVKMKTESVEPLVHRQNRPADLPSIGDLLDAAARIKPWKATGELRVICDTGSFQLQMMDAAFKTHHESIMPHTIRTSNVRVLSLPRRTTPFTAPWRQRAVAAGLDGRRLLAISDYVNFSYSNDLWLIELLASRAPLVLCGKHLVVDERFSDWLESLQERGIQSGWLPGVNGDSTDIEPVPQGLKSHADGLLFFFSECYHSAGS